ncbi:unnamed protein product [Polarella glacialis]|uniref:RanBP2-type domain-containing protein n=2 Tax=Polarella glacialis TaxID=89957 RepID=A0A813DG30_POLGL|nr:unnamed protein product [Polarella glacialis]
MTDSQTDLLPVCCVFCKEPVVPNYDLLFEDQTCSGHVACLQAAERNTGDVWSELAELVTRSGGGAGGGGSSLDAAKRALEFCGWPGRGQDDGPFGWPGKGDTRPPPAMTSVPAVLLQLRGLHRIEFSHQPLTTLPAHGWRYLGLERLCLSSCLLRELPEEIAEIVTLEVLIVSQNMLHRLPDGIGQLPRLRNLMAVGNQLSGLSFGPPRLQNLTAEGNMIQVVPHDLLQRCPWLSELRLAGNPMSFEAREAEATAACDAPDEAAMPGNAVAAAAAPSALEIAYFQGCRMTQLPVAMLGQRLMWLALSDNRLRGPLPAALSQLKLLRWLCLYGNCLEELPEGLLRGCDSLSACLLEGNPLSAGAMRGLLRDVQHCDPNRRERLRVLGVDASQIRTWRASWPEEVQTSEGAPLAEDQARQDMLPQPLPACVQSGWRVSRGGGWYAKLIPSSQVCRAAGDPVLGEREGEEFPPDATRTAKKVLLSAFAASQGEPEWGGEFGRLHAQRRHRVALQAYGLRNRTLRQHVEEARASHPAFSGGESDIAASLWVGYNRAPQDAVVEDTQDLIDDDFDVLLLVDPRRRWYNEEQSGPSPLDRGSFREDFAAIASRYGRVCAVGASMGGFAALSCADLVDAVLAFGPQIDLDSATYKPGFASGALEEATGFLRQAVANRRGSVECHMSLDAHLFQATRLHPLPARESNEALSSGRHAAHLRLVVHPFKGRAARLLEKAGLLLPLLAETLERLQREARGEGGPGEVEGASAEDEEWPTWQWPGGPIGSAQGKGEVQDNGCPPEDMASPSLLVGCWSSWVRLQTGETTAWLPPTLRVLRATALEVRALAQNAPLPGQWFCPACGSANNARQPCCRLCGPSVSLLEQPEAGVAAVPGGEGPRFRWDDWICLSCNRLEYKRELSCGQCRGWREEQGAAVERGIAGCSNQRCWTIQAAGQEEALEPHSSDGLLYCQGCTRKWEQRSQPGL